MRQDVTVGKFHAISVCASACMGQPEHMSCGMLASQAATTGDCASGEDEVSAICVVLQNCVESRGLLSER